MYGILILSWFLLQLCPSASASLLYLIGLFVQAHFAKSVNSNVVQDKTSYDTILTILRPSAMICLVPPQINQRKPVSCDQNQVHVTSISLFSLVELHRGIIETSPAGSRRHTAAAPAKKLRRVPVLRVGRKLNHYAYQSS